LIAAAVVGLTGLFATDAQAGGGSATVTAGSGTVAPAGSITVDLTVTPTGTLVGALDVDIQYDPAVLDATGASNPTCNHAFDQDDVAPDVIRCSLANLTGLSGVVSTLTFAAPGADGTSSPLTVVISSCSDEQGNPIDPCTGVDGLINVQAATPTPEPTDTPAPTDTPVPGAATDTPVPGAATATPGTLPQTGGGSGSGTLPLLLAAMGIAALTAGAWAITRLRRVEA
jgi:hypothetical protein